MEVTWFWNFKPIDFEPVSKMANFRITILLTTSRSVFRFNKCRQIYVSSAPCKLFVWIFFGNQCNMKLKLRHTCMHEYALSIIIVLIKHCELWLYGYIESDLIAKTWHKFNIVSRPWKWGQGQVTHAKINVWTKYDEPRS